MCLKMKFSQPISPGPPCLFLLHQRNNAFSLFSGIDVDIKEKNSSSQLCALYVMRRQRAFFSGSTCRIAEMLQ